MNPSQDLLRACAKGDRKAQPQLFRLCFPYMMSISIRYHQNQEDARYSLNLAFYKILKNLKKYDDKQSFKAWIRVILINTIISEHKKNKNYLSIMAPMDFTENTQIFTDQDYDTINNEMGLQHLLNTINQIGEPEKTILNLYAIEGYTHKEIGEMLHIPVGTSRWYLSKAKKKLRELIEKSMKQIKVIMM